MTSLTDTLIDKRVVQRNINKGLVDPKELDKHIKALPDVANNGEVVSYDDESDSAEDETDGEE